MDGTLVVSLGAGVLALVVTAAALGPLARWLRRRALLDMPNDRSSHHVPTPRGGGLAVTTVVVLGWAACLILMDAMTPLLVALLVGATALGVLSWLDDIHDLPRRLRFGLHVVGVIPILAMLPADSLVAQGLLPVWMDRLFAALAWLWFMNLFNFMDGIDGISGVETAHLGLGVAVLAHLGLVAVAPVVALLGAVTSGAALGFLLWNWHPAKVFLGDVGSIPLGYILGWMMLEVAISGAWAVALILPAYYFADATLTLVRRLMKGNSPVVAHRDHYYQRATHRLGMSHGAVSLRVALGNLMLLAAAGVAVKAEPWLGLLAGVVPVVALLVLFGRTLTPRGEEIRTP